jgi:hypothetical protein
MGGLMGDLRRNRGEIGGDLKGFEGLNGTGCRADSPVHFLSLYHIMQIGGGTKYLDGRWQASGRDQYSQHEADVLNSLDVKVGVDVLTTHISAEWWSSTNKYGFYSSLKKMIHSINETDPSYQEAKNFINTIESQLKTIINLRKQKNIEEFERRQPHPPIEDVITNEDKHRIYIQFIKSYGRHIHYLKHITIAYYLLHLMPEPKVQSILYQTHRVFTSIIDLAKEYAEFKCNQNYTKIPALNKWRNNYNKIKLELTPEEYYKHQFWNRLTLLCNQQHGGKSRRKQRRKSTRHHKQHQRRKKSTRRRHRK